MFDAYVIHDISKFNTPYPKFSHMHIALDNVVWTQKYIAPTYHQTFIVIWEIEHWMSCKLLNMLTYIRQSRFMSVCLYIYFKIW